MIIMSELHRKIIRNKLRKMDFDVDSFATEVENFARDYINNPISYAAQRSIEDYMKILRRSNEETEKPIFKDTVNNTDGNNDFYTKEEVSDDSLLQQRFAEKLAADIREVLSVHKLRKVAALTLCYKLGIPSSTRILFGLCTPVQLKRCRIKKRNIFKDKETNVIK